MITMSGAPANSRKLDCFLYDSEVPDFVFNELTLTYQSMYCTKAYCDAFYPRSILKAVKVSLGDKTLQILIFTIVKDSAIILNKVFRLEPDELDEVSKMLFSHYRHLNYLRFDALIYEDFKGAKSPHMVVGTYEDVVVRLPKNFGNYQSRFGKKTKRHLRYYMGKLKKSFNQVNFEVLTPPELTPQIISQIIGFNKLRTVKKGYRQGIDRDNENKIVNFTCQNGCVCVMKIDGQISAGAILFNLKNDAFLQVISHDAKFDGFDLGLVCLSNTIQYCIEQGIGNFHFLWGEAEYKRRFQGTGVKLVNMLVFKNRFSKLRNINKKNPYYRELFIQKIIFNPQIKHFIHWYHDLMLKKRNSLRS
jgi:hypothetical protein